MQGRSTNAQLTIWNIHYLNSTCGLIWGLDAVRWRTVRTWRRGRGTNAALRRRTRPRTCVRRHCSPTRDTMSCLASHAASLDQQWRSHYSATMCEFWGGSCMMRYEHNIGSLTSVSFRTISCTVTMTRPSPSVGFLMILAFIRIIPSFNFSPSSVSIENNS